MDPRRAETGDLAALALRWSHHPALIHLYSFSSIGITSDGENQMPFPGSAPEMERISEVRWQS